ncbi:hypothetical protein TraAM80_08447 [Trypanosoma rangeli]|uniref:Uncharacterized protein n=1 Tax=Trypanosoma rangeli TaxID=5698 RepID=A0A3R7RB02_TRYRA|nr:uncharacterized protein TraAM80_08447 [Trypanosoma rangeli]RNE99097.1 hypothetical protein TraAM80_08447 [Trypanosoma rangeli]|eukprot:RNE99097.1 hypothetical protein TraAM80_08447 [Trypanosoma rangeli]
MFIRNRPATSMQRREPLLGCGAALRVGALAKQRTPAPPTHLLRRTGGKHRHIAPKQPGTAPRHRLPAVAGLILNAPVPVKASRVLHGGVGPEDAALLHLQRGVAAARAAVAAVRCCLVLADEPSRLGRHGHIGEGRPH